MKNASRIETVSNAHVQMLIALRQREQDIVRFLIILGPTIGTYLYLVRDYFNTTTPYLHLASDSCCHGLQPFLLETIAIEFVLAIGVWYAVALGYNYRTIEYQLSKFEFKLGIENSILKAWQSYESRAPKSFCAPPEIIKVFWIAFLISFVGVGLSSLIVMGAISYHCVWWFTIVVLALFAVPPYVYGIKFAGVIKTEKS